MDGPARDAIEVWLARTDVDAEALAELRNVLDEEERARAARFRFDEDRARSIVARATLRRILGRYLDRDPRALRFVAGEHGKPALADGELEFNVSHSGERVALAFATSTPIGIDIERERQMRDAFALACRFFAPAEAAEVGGDEGQFFRIWTAKEAVIKAIGTGLAIDLRSFEAFAESSQLVRVVERGDDARLRGWYVQSLVVEDGYRCAIATRGSGWNVTLREARD